MSITPAMIPKRRHQDTAPHAPDDGFDMTRNYQFDTRDYWKKRATRRQQLIESRDADIKALETRLIELEDELAELKKGKK